MKITSSSTELMTKQNTDLIPNNKSEMSMLNSNNVIDFQGVFSNTNAQFMPKCPLCEKTFANSSNLKHHMNTIHFNEAKWICNECGKVCTSKSNLKVHLRVHLRVKPYYCRWCDYNCMHHSSIRDHLSKCHPDKSHNSCEPGYIFNSTAVPEPELSHFEPNTSMHSFDKTNKILNSTSINNKRSLLNDSMKDEPNESANEFSSLHYSNEELANNIKKFKQDYEINKLKKSKKFVKNKFRGFKDKPQIITHQPIQQQQHLETQNNDDFQQNNDNYDQNNTYYSDDENNTSIDETLNENPTLHNKNSSPSASISSSTTNDSHISSTSNSKNNLNNLHTLQFLTSNFSNINNNGSNSSQNQQAEFFANLFSNLPNMSDYQAKTIQESGSVNNIASAILQRLSTVALFQQFSNNELTKKLHNEDLTSPETNKNSDSIETDAEHYEDLNKQDLKPKSQCGLDLSLKAKKQKGCDNDTSDEYFSALSPVSTSSTNLSTSSLSSLSKLKIKEEKSHRLEKPTDSNGSKKGILDVINRIKSQKSTSQSESSDIVKEEEKTACLDHDAGNTGLDELNDLIKSHLLPISEAVFDKYKTFFNCKKSLENREDESDYDEHTDNFHETPSGISTHDDSHLKTDTLKKKCTFCNIFKNLLDLHELLHTS